MTVAGVPATDDSGRVCTCRGMDEKPGCDHGGSVRHSARPGTAELREEIARAYAVWAEAPFEPADWQLRNGEEVAVAVLALPRVQRLLAVERRVRRLAEEWEGESVSAMTRADVARDRDDRVLYTTNVRHARVAHHAAAALLGALDGGDDA